AAGTGLPHERRTLGIALSGPLALSWVETARPADFYDLKGVLETALGSLKVARYRFTATRHPTFHPGRCALLEVAPLVDDTGAHEHAITNAAAWLTVGVLGEVHPEVAERFDLAERTYLAELDLERLYAAVPERVTAAPIARYPAAARDLAVVVDASVAAAALAEAIRARGAPLLRDARLFDVYTGEGIPAGKKSLAYSLTYQSPERTLTDAEIERAHAGIVAALRAQLGAEPRS
ncbi:MAG: phenylalanine--tRNA ligase subunit beta, partial [Ktedonobacterales bacterium]